MVGITADKPYEGYNLYRVFDKRMGRWLAVLHRSCKDRHTISYARYIMSVKEGRILEKWETVDHKDEDHSNDNIDNLQILTQLENNRKHVKALGLEEKMSKLICPNCHKDFEIATSQEKSKRKNSKNIFCSRRCSGIFYPSELRKIYYGNGNLPHGTVNCYNYYKCRCEMCTEVQRIAHKKWADKKKEEHSRII